MLIYHACGLLYTHMLLSNSFEWTTSLFSTKFRTFSSSLSIFDFAPMYLAELSNEDTVR